MKTNYLKGWRPIIVLLLFFFLWEILVKKTNVPEWLLPAPSKIIKEMITGWESFSGHLLATTKLGFSGFAIGVCIGLLTAVLLHVVPFVRESVYPLLILSQNVPVIVLAPLLVIWFGFGVLPKMIVITLVCFFRLLLQHLMALNKQLLI
jgi:ABC-type nitrate/sulfonate/bicarbonate transport system permease component